MRAGIWSLVLSCSVNKELRKFLDRPSPQGTDPPSAPLTFVFLGPFWRGRQALVLMSWMRTVFCWQFLVSSTENERQGNGGSLLIPDFISIRSVWICLPEMRTRKRKTRKHILCATIKDEIMRTGGPLWGKPNYPQGCASTTMAVMNCCSGKSTAGVGACQPGRRVLQNASVGSSEEQEQDLPEPGQLRNPFCKRQHLELAEESEGALRAGMKTRGLNGK